MVVLKIPPAEGNSNERVVAVVCPIRVVSVCEEMISSNAVANIALESEIEI